MRDTQQQSRLERPEQRRANVLGAYGVKKHASVQGRRILVVDDVITTGSTIEECCRMLTLAGAAEIHCAAVVQAVGREGREAKNDETLANEE